MIKNPVRDYRSVEMIVTHQHSSPLGLQPIKALSCKPTACNTNGGSFFYRAMQT
ncbi:MAG: hypothetical protein LBT56_01930 [Prevotellaceae bacterium]|nr:hypothetical protein [Prevotellaceae bacterium]